MSYSLSGMSSPCAASRINNVESCLVLLICYRSWHEDIEQAISFVAGGHRRDNRTIRNLVTWL